MVKDSHPYHYSKKKVTLDRIVDFGVPMVLFLLFFFFYNQAQFTPKEMVKNTGLLSISLLAITLAVGPFSKLIPPLEFLKAYRKVWGILSFVAAFTHISLIFIFFFHFDLTRFIDFGNPRYPNILTGLIALGILSLVTLTSNQKALNLMHPKMWKAVQTTSYLALVFAMLHFYLLSLEDGIFVMKNLLVQFTFWFSALVLTLRILVLLIFRG